MKRFIDEQNKVVVAKNFQEAAEKLYGQTPYQNPAITKFESLLETTVVHKTHKGTADVKVYNVGDKQGTFWGVQAATPKLHTLTKVKK